MKNCSETKSKRRWTGVDREEDLDLCYGWLRSTVGW